MRPDENFEEELRVAKQAAMEAGDVVMGLYGRDYQVREKSRGNPVTTADLEADGRIREILLAHFPQDGWLSEESEESPLRLESSRVWIVDPIDGTKEFIRGVPQFAVSIGLVVGQQAVVGVVFNPVKQELFTAVQGGGARSNGRPIQVSDRQDPQGACLLVSRSEPRRRFELLTPRYRLVPMGSIAYRLALVGAAAGDATLTFRSVREWDVCAGALIVEEAGGVVVDGAGKRLRFNQRVPVCRGLVASNRALTEEIQQALGSTLKTPEVSPRSDP